MLGAGSRIAAHRTGIEKIFALAREQGWTASCASCHHLRRVDDNHDDGDEVTAEAARAAIRRGARVSQVGSPFPKRAGKSLVDDIISNRSMPEMVIPAINAPTGISKTQIAIAEMAEWMRETSFQS